MATEINKAWKMELSKGNWKSYIAIPLFFYLYKNNFLKADDFSLVACMPCNSDETSAKLKLATNFLGDAGLLTKKDGIEKQTYSYIEIDFFSAIVAHWADVDSNLNALLYAHKKGVTLLNDVRDQYGIGHAYDLSLQFNDSIFIVNFYRFLSVKSDNLTLDIKDHKALYKALCEFMPCLLDSSNPMSLKEIYNTLKITTALDFLSVLDNLDFFFDVIFSSNTVNLKINDLEKNQRKPQGKVVLSLFTKIAQYTSNSHFPVTVDNLTSLKNHVSRALFFLLELRCFGLVPAEEFLELAANFGLFSEQYTPEFSLGRYRWGSVSQFLQRSYSICRAEYEDLDRLFELENFCWESDLAQTRETIAKRITDYPEGQFVLKCNDLILGVVYSQRIKDFNLIKSYNSNNVHLLHDEGGSIVQLLAINISPDSQDLRLGDQLLDFILQKCAFTNGIDTVVGITLCKSFHKQNSLGFDEYIKQRNEFGGCVDPILHFHQSHGAKVLGSIPNYRKKDYKNVGRGVLVYYDMRRWKLSTQLLDQQNPREVSSQKRSDLNDNDILAVSLYVKNEIFHHLPESKNDNLLDDEPLMEMGLDSSDFLILQAKFSERFNIHLSSTFFFKYNTFKKIIYFINEKLQEKRYSIDNSINNQNASIEISCSTDSLNSGEGSPDKDIAIIGTACRLPGEINDLESFWEMLRTGAEKIERLSDDRLNWGYANINGDKIEELNYGGFLNDIDCFDADFFRISPKEANYMDPQQRIMLELAWEAIETAGVPPENIKKNRTGVFIGASGSDYSKLIIDQGINVEAQMATGCSMSVIANRISYFLDASGPSVLIDTACSSSLVAVHQAVQSLRNGECKQAFAGGINLILHNSSGLAYLKSGMLSKDGRCYCFDERANGYVRSEGAGVIFIKPLNDAIEDKDNILAVIKGSACSHGGIAAGLTVPSSEAQARLILDAWKNAGISGTHVSYIEAHGTGTPLGDPIEIEGISTAILQARNGTIGKKVVIGSIKSNIGHLEAAAGIAGLLKVALALKHKMLPPVANYKTANPKLELSIKPIEIARNLNPWNETSRIAGVSSFGSGGTNAHVVLQEYIQLESITSPIKLDGELIFLLSAKSLEALTFYVSNFKKFLDEITNNVSIEDICNTLLFGRKTMQFRVVCVIRNLQDLREKLEFFSVFMRSLSKNKSISKENYVTLFNSFFPRLKGDSEFLNRLALEWVAGADVAPTVSLLSTCKRLNLPTYPFQRKRYWIKSTLSNEAVAPDSILGAKVYSKVGRIVFENTWHVVPNFMKYHQENFQCISLGFVVEMLALAAGCIKNNTKYFNFINLRFFPYEIDNSAISLETVISSFNETIVIEIFQFHKQQQFLIARAEILDGPVNENNTAIILSGTCRNNITFQKFSMHSLFLKNIIYKNNEYKLMTPINSINDIFPFLAEKHDECILINQLNVATSLGNTNSITTCFSGSEIFLYGEQRNLIASFSC